MHDKAIPVTGLVMFLGFLSLQVFKAEKMCLADWIGIGQ